MQRIDERDPIVRRYSVQWVTPDEEPVGSPGFDWSCTCRKDGRFTMETCVWACGYHVAAEYVRMFWPRAGAMMVEQFVEPIVERRCEWTVAAEYAAIVSVIVLSAVAVWHWIN